MSAGCVGSGFRTWGLEFGVRAPNFRVCTPGLRMILGFRVRMWGLRAYRAWDRGVPRVAGPVALCDQHDCGGMPSELSSLVFGECGARP